MIHIIWQWSDWDSGPGWASLVDSRVQRTGTNNWPAVVWTTLSESSTSIGLQYRNIECTHCKISIILWSIVNYYEFYIVILICAKAKKNKMCVYCHMLKNLGSVGIFFLFNFVFYNWIDNWCWMTSRMHFYTSRVKFILFFVKKMIPWT